MKTILITIVILISTTIFAQEKTIFGANPDISHGGFGAPVVKFSNVNGDFGVLTGARGGWIINHKVSLGFGGYGLATNTKLNGLVDGKERYLDFVYGGFELEYILCSEKVFHLTFIALIGGGGVDYRFSKNRYYDDRENCDREFDSFFVGEPTINAELNVTSFLRMDVGVGYRFVAGSDSDYITDSKLSSFSGVLQLKFGSF